MHPIQQQLLTLSEQYDLASMTYREIGSLIDIKHAQTIKHHMLQLQKKGFLLPVEQGSKKLRPIAEVLRSNSDMLAVPILGSANCGVATMIAEERAEGYLKISSSLLKEHQGIFALKAAGDSMNMADIDGKEIENGDYVIIAPQYGQPRNGDYILSVIDGSANIKQFVFDEKNNHVVLLSKSTKEYDPIFIHPDDDYHINGRVVQVVKVPRNQ